MERSGWSDRSIEYLWFRLLRELGVNPNGQISDGTTAGAKEDVTSNDKGAKIVSGEAAGLVTLIYPSCSVNLTLESTKDTF